jgi:protease-4
MNNKQVIAVLAIVIMSFSSLFVYFATNRAMEANYSWTERVVEGGGSAKIAQIFVEGVISPELDKTRPSVLSQLDAAIEDSQVKGIVLAVSTPGGDVVTSDHIYQKIIQAKKSGKVVAVSMGPIAASGGYYISTPAHKIYANPLTVTGSIGVIMSFSNYKALADKIGYREINISTGEYKSMGDPMSEFTQETKHIYQSIVDESYKQFINIIVNNRNLDRNTVVKLADGRVFSGSQAKSLGLVDELGNVEDATKYVKKKLGLQHYKLVQYEGKSSFFTGLLAEAASPVSTVERQIQEIKSIFENSTPRILYMVK